MLRSPDQKSVYLHFQLEIYLERILALSLEYFKKKLIKSTLEKKIAVRTKHLPLLASATEHLGGYHKIHNQYYQIRFVQWWWFRADDCVKRTMEQLHLPSSVVGLLAAKLCYSSERILIAIR